MFYLVRENVLEDIEEVYVIFILDEIVLDIVLGSLVILKEYVLMFLLKILDMR